MEFEYDASKSILNEKKHGIDFKEAQKIWLDSKSIIVPAKSVDGESRFAIIGLLDKKCWVGIFTIREYNYRIISVRRCRKYEEKKYDSG